MRGIYGRFDSQIRFEIESDGRFDSRFDSNAKNDSQVPSFVPSYSQGAHASLKVIEST